MGTGQLCCDLLSFYYLCRTGNNSCVRARCGKRLWFAFILLSLSYWKQLSRSWVKPTDSCDLLSFYYLCRTGNNIRVARLTCRAVVICFHFTIFVVLETTHRAVHGWRRTLWFAFILLSLSYWKQLRARGSSRRIRCDLLSFYYLCRTGNNSHRTPFDSTQVVICFHFTIFVVLETTSRSWVKPVDTLWFAFILLSLSYWKQRQHWPDLLVRVVICFHFTIFVVLETTLREWPSAKPSCDLLSFYYLCRTGNNTLQI